MCAVCSAMTDSPGGPAGKAGAGLLKALGRGSVSWTDRDPQRVATKRSGRAVDLDAGFFEEYRDVRPECPPVVPFGLRQFRHLHLVTHARKTQVRSPVGQTLPDE